MNNNSTINSRNLVNNKLLFLILLIILKQLIIKIKIIDKIIKRNKQENKKKEEINFNTVFFWNSTYLKNEMHSYSLYNVFKSPLISLILIENNSLRLHDLSTIKKIENISSNYLTNIEIILVIKKSNAREVNLIKKSLPKFILEKNILLFYYYDVEPKEIYTNLINIIRAKYTIFINNFNILQKLQMNELFNETKGKIDNYLKINITNEISIFLLRTKKLKYLNDNGIKYYSVELLLNMVESISIPHMNYISISLCPNNKYSTLSYVAMSSILSSKASNTYICFYLIIPADFEKRNYNFFESLYELYDYFNITYIVMDNRYDKLFANKKITTQYYYRLSLGELLQNLNRTIYIDADIIVYKDLSNFYNLNFNGKMFLGHPTIGNKKGIIQINTGILLMNLFEMRKNKFEKNAIEMIKKTRILKLYDQTLINTYFKHYIGFFPPEYHTRPWSNYKEMEIFNYKIGNIFDNDYLYFAHKYPVIRHFFGEYKPINHKTNHIEDWWFFARKSKYYNDSADSFENAFSF